MCARNDSARNCRRARCARVPSNAIFNIAPPLTPIRECGAYCTYIHTDTRMRARRGFRRPAAYRPPRTRARAPSVASGAHVNCTDCTAGRATVSAPPKPPSHSATPRGAPHFAVGHCGAREPRRAPPGRGPPDDEAAASTATGRGVRVRERPSAGVADDRGARAPGCVGLADDRSALTPGRSDAGVASMTSSTQSARRAEAMRTAAAVRSNGLRPDKRPVRAGTRDVRRSDRHAKQSFHESSDPRDSII